MSSVGERVDALEKKVYHQGGNIKVLTEKINSIKDATDKLFDSMENHMNREADVVKGIYDKLNSVADSIAGKLKSMDTELKTSFDKRDEKIKNINTANVKIDTKLTIYISFGAFLVAVMTQLIMLAIKHWW